MLGLEILVRCRHLLDSRGHPVDRLLPHPFLVIKLRTHALKLHLRCVGAVLKLLGE
jgi:hypothetical protein